tara:strand:+ start:86 stop:226 length:141 start_codon:yes stop_codon:yes gene_type:complete
MDGLWKRKIWIKLNGFLSPSNKKTASKTYMMQILEAYFLIHDAKNP